MNRRWYRLLAIGPLVLLLSFLPSVTYMGHWTELIGLAHVEEEELMEHAGHCHLGTASCADQPLPPDLSVTPAVVHMAAPKLTSLLLEGDQQIAEERVVVPLTEPPRTVAGT